MGTPRPRLAGKLPIPCLVLAGLGLMALLLSPLPLHGEGEATVRGRVVNGSSGGADPADLEVALHIFGDSGEVDIATASADASGRFEFVHVEVDEGFAYAVTTSYEDILYSVRLEPATLGEEPVDLVVYETTSSLEGLQVAADVLLVGGIEGDKGSLSAFRVISVMNDADRTFVPDLAQPARMNFLRFSLPTGATNVDVDSNLPGGEIITIGTGFALTAPVTPGSHQVAYTYRIPYQGSHLELVHSFPMGAETFRLLIDDAVGRLEGSGALAPMPAINVEGRSHSVWGATELSPGTKLSLNIVDLARPPMLRRLGDALTDGPYLNIGIPSVVGLVLASLLVYSMAFRRAGRESSVVSGPVAAAAAVSTDAAQRGQDHPIDERRALVEEIASLDNLFHRGEVPEDDYHQRRQELKDRLLLLALASKGEVQLE